MLVLFPSHTIKKNRCISAVFHFWSGRSDSNRRPLQPHCNALAGLRHAPDEKHYKTNWVIWQDISPSGSVLRFKLDNGTPASVYRFPHPISQRLEPTWDYQHWLSTYRPSCNLSPWLVRRIHPSAEQSRPYSSTLVEPAHFWLTDKLVS